MRKSFLILFLAGIIHAQDIAPQIVDAKTNSTWENQLGEKINGKLLSIEIDSITILVNEQIYHYPIDKLGDNSKIKINAYKREYYNKIIRNDLDYDPLITDRLGANKQFKQLVELRAKYRGLFIKGDLDAVNKQLREDLGASLTPLNEFQKNYLNKIIKPLIDSWNVKSIKVNDK